MKTKYVRLWRNPTVSDIKFGYGNTHYLFADVPVTAKRWVKIRGVRWQLPRR